MPSQLRFYPALTGSILLLESGIEISANKLMEIIFERQQEFQNFGLASGDRVFLEASLTVEFFVQFFSLSELGAITFVIDGKQTLYEMRKLDDRFSPAWRIPAKGSIERIDRKKRSSTESSPPGACLVLFTSGTSSEPKAVVHGPSNLRARIEAGHRAIPKADRARSLCLLPPHFGHGLIGVCLATLLGGECLAIPPDLSIASFAKVSGWIDQSALTFISGTPTTWSLLLRTSRPPKSTALRRIQIASAPTNSELCQEIHAWSKAPLWNVDGLTECASWVSDFEVRNPGDERWIGDGAKWGTEFRILDPNQNGIGEIEISTESLFLGYWEETYRPLGSKRFSTQDIGFKDDVGRVSISGRLNRIINRGGAKISPEEIELELRRSTDVLDAVIISVPHEDSTDGIGALVVLADPERKLEALQAIESGLRANLSSHKLPTDWRVCESIPRRTNGKPDLVEIGLLWNRLKISSS